jgi:hypothetical protein
MVSLLEDCLVDGGIVEENWSTGKVRTTSLGEDQLPADRRALLAYR